MAYISMIAKPLLAQCSSEKVKTVQDGRYLRVNHSSRLAHKARLAFVNNVKEGEILADLGSAALQISSEDDAIISNSPVEFPVESYLKRMKQISDTIARKLVLIEKNEPKECIAIIEDTLSHNLGFRCSSWGQSNLPEKSLVDHPGVWEDQKYGYLHEMLISKCGTPALFTILYQHIMKTLLSDKVIDFTVSFAHGDFSSFPEVCVIPGMHRNSVLTKDGRVLNTCSFDVLFEILYFLKRSFWPFSWNTNNMNHGGFKHGCENVLFRDQSAEMEAISRSAEHRLSRGIWTTTGGGDMLRAVAACERIVLLNGTDNSLDRRDLALLYFSLGDYSAAFGELKVSIQNSITDNQDLQEQKLVHVLYEQAKQMKATRSVSGALTIDQFLAKEISCLYKTCHMLSEHLCEFPFDIALDDFFFES